MFDQKLRVRAVGDVRVPNLDVPNGHSHRFVGRVYDAKANDWPSVGDYVEVPYRHEYVDAIKFGELEVDEPTRAFLLSKNVIVPSGHAGGAE